VRTRCLISSLIVQLAFLSTARGGDVQQPSSAQSILETLATELHDQKVSRVEILEIPPRVLTRTSITPELLETTFHYKLVIREVRGSAYQSKLHDALAATEVVEVGERTMPDLRWGIVFYGENEDRLAAAYFDKSGRRGAINNTPVSARGGLFDWLNSSFGECFK
jgi:hypothetical protein